MAQDLVVPGPLDPVLMPVLRERPALDLVNTLYRRDGTVLDFLATPAHVGMWAAAALPVGWSTRSPAEGSDLRALRAAARPVLDAVADGESPREDDLAVLNRAASRAAYRRSLVLRDGRAVVMERDAIRPDHRTSTLLALDVIDVAAERPAPLVRCARPGCSMLFLRTHHLRRYCTPSCAHIDRQQRYLRSRRSP